MVYNQNIKIEVIIGYVAPKRMQYMFKGHVQCTWSGEPLDTCHFLFTVT